VVDERADIREGLEALLTMEKLPGHAGVECAEG